MQAHKKRGFTTQFRRDTTQFAQNSIPLLRRAHSIGTTADAVRTMKGNPMETMVLQPVTDPILTALDFEMTGPGADEYTMDFSLCTSTTTTCSTTGPRPK